MVVYKEMVKRGSKPGYTIPFKSNPNKIQHPNSIGVGWGGYSAGYYKGPCVSAYGAPVPCAG